MNLATSFFIMVIIFVGKLIINKLADTQCYSVHSQQDKAVLTKLLFFNMSCNIVVPFVFAQYIVKNQNAINWLPNLFFMVIFSCFSHLSYRLMNPVLIVALVRRFLVRRYRKFEIYHQEKLNKIY